MTTRFTSPKLLILSVLWGVLGSTVFGVETGKGAVTLERDIKPLHEQYCFGCHNKEKTKGDLNLEEIAKNPKLAEHRVIGNKVIESLESGERRGEKSRQDD